MVVLTGNSYLFQFYEIGVDACFFLSTTLTMMDTFTTTILEIDNAGTIPI
jgi:hypothetical protein